MNREILETRLAGAISDCKYISTEDIYRMIRDIETSPDYTPTELNLRCLHILLGAILINPEIGKAQLIKIIDQVSLTRDEITNLTPDTLFNDFKTSGRLATLSRSEFEGSDEHMFQKAFRALYHSMEFQQIEIDYSQIKLLRIRHVNCHPPVVGFQLFKISLLFKGGGTHCFDFAFPHSDMLH